VVIVDENARPQLAQDRSSPRGPLCRFYPPCCSERKVRWAAAALSQVQQRAGQPPRSRRFV